MAAIHFCLLCGFFGTRKSRKPLKDQFLQPRMAQDIFVEIFEGLAGGASSVTELPDKKSGNSACCCCLYLSVGATADICCLEPSITISDHHRRHNEPL